MIYKYSYATEMKCLVVNANFTLTRISSFAADCHLYVLVQMKITKVLVFLQFVSCECTHTHVHTNFTFNVFLLISLNCSQSKSSRQTMFPVPKCPKRTPTFKLLLHKHCFLWKFQLTLHL